MSNIMITLQEIKGGFKLKYKSISCEIHEDGKGWYEFSSVRGIKSHMYQCRSYESAASQFKQAILKEGVV